MEYEDNRNLKMLAMAIHKVIIVLCVLLVLLVVMLIIFLS